MILLEQVISRIKRLMGKGFTGRVMIDFVNGTVSKKIYVQTAEILDK